MNDSALPEGEAGDLCSPTVTNSFGGHPFARYWSNHLGACAPA